MIGSEQGANGGVAADGNESAPPQGVNEVNTRENANFRSKNCGEPWRTNAGA